MFGGEFVILITDGTCGLFGVIVRIVVICFQVLRHRFDDTKTTCLAAQDIYAIAAAPHEGEALTVAGIAPPIRAGLGTLVMLGVSGHSWNCSIFLLWVPYC